MLIKFSGNYGEYRYCDGAIPFLCDIGDGKGVQDYLPYQSLIVSTISAENYSQNISLKINLDNQNNKLTQKEIDIYKYYLLNSNIVVFDELKNQKIFVGKAKSITQQNKQSLEINGEGLANIIFYKNITPKITHKDNCINNKAEGTWLGGGFNDIILKATTIISQQSFKKFEILDSFNKQEIKIQWNNNPDIIQCEEYTGIVNGNIIQLYNPLPLMPLEITNTIALLSTYDKEIKTAITKNNIANFRGFPYVVFDEQKKNSIVLKPSII